MMLLCFANVDQLIIWLLMRNLLVDWSHMEFHMELYKKYLADLAGYCGSNKDKLTIHIR